MNRRVFTVELHQARDAEESYGIRLPGENGWRARSGFGSQYELVWKVEFQCVEELDLETADWEPILGRTIEAYRLSDPVVTNFEVSYVTPKK